MLNLNRYRPLDMLLHRSQLSLLVSSYGVCLPHSHTIDLFIPQNSFLRNGTSAVFVNCTGIICVVKNCFSYVWTRNPLLLHVVNTLVAALNVKFYHKCSMTVFASFSEWFLIWIVCTIIGLILVALTYFPDFVGHIVYSIL